MRQYGEGVACRAVGRWRVAEMGVWGRWCGVGSDGNPCTRALPYAHTHADHKILYRTRAQSHTFNAQPQPEPPIAPPPANRRPNSADLFCQFVGFL